MSNQTTLFPDTLAAAKVAYLAATKEKGMKCPCCDRFGKRYRYLFNSGMAMSLIWLVHQEGWVNVAEKAPRAVISARKFDKLNLWGLCERQPKEDGVARESGVWAATESGKDFVRHQTPVPRYAILYSGAAEIFSTESITIRESLGVRFNYDDLMARFGDA